MPPRVSVVIAAYNEEAYLEQTLLTLECLLHENAVSEVIVGSDGSTDQTNSILQLHIERGVKPLLFDRREGKASTLNRAVYHATGDILIFCDATTQITSDAIRKLVRHFNDPGVGVVCGCLTFLRSKESERTEGVYWTYECLLRLMEARLGATLTASGAFYAIRRISFQSLPTNALIDDLLIPMAARQLGYKVVYDPEAIATEFAASGVVQEGVRRTRLALGSFRALPQLLRAKMPVLTLFAFISHKLFRWFLPFVQIAFLFSNVCLVMFSRSSLRSWYLIGFAAQAAFYMWAFLGACFRPRMQRFRYGLAPYFLVAMNLAFIKGFYRSLRPDRAGIWERAG
jgi:cellulose synthase/poly-beta-1,6-N-acetylglucosamine synthase-like glycosyltransferase